MTTPDKEEMPTDKAAGPWIVHYGEAVKIKDANGYTVASLSQIHLHGRRSKNEVEKTARFIVIACNAYEPMREALAFYAAPENHGLQQHGLCFASAVDIDEGERARAALSTLPVNDRQTSDDVGRLRKATAAIEDDDLRNDLADICTQALADAPEVLADPRGLDVLLDAIVCLFRDKAHAALKGVPQPAKPEPEARIVTSHALPVTMWDSIATAVVKRVAELPDRSSPDNWPEAMLVTSEELHHIIMSEFDNEVG